MRKQFRTWQIFWLNQKNLMKSCLTSILRLILMIRRFWLLMKCSYLLKDFLKESKKKVKLTQIFSKNMKKLKLSTFLLKVIPCLSPELSSVNLWKKFSKSKSSFFRLELTNRNIREQSIQVSFMMDQNDTQMNQFT